MAVALLGTMGTIGVGPAPAYAASPVPTVTLTGQLIQLADQTGPAVSAIRTADKQLVPVDATAVKNLKPGSAVTLNVVVPAAVRSVAAANEVLTVRGPNGRTTSTPLDDQDLAAASDGTPEPATSDLGRATVDSAVSTGQALAVSAVVSAADPVSSFVPATRHLFVAIVRPLGWLTPNTVTQSQIQTQVARASNYWSTLSSRGVSLDIASITAQYTSAYNCTNPLGMLNEAAKHTAFPDTPNTSLVVELPADIPGCGYGLGTIGANVNDSGMLYVSDDAFPVLAHELGHNMSLQHADTLECPSASDSVFDGTSWTGSGCTEVSYGDGTDVMGPSARSFAPFLSSPQSLRTGLIPDDGAQVISANGTTNVTLNALGSLGGVRAAEVVDPTNGVTYYVEYRVATTPDTVNVYGEAVGVRVLRINPTTGATILLDATPTTTPSSDKDATVRAGGTFSSYSGAVRVTTISTTSATATIAITRNVTAPHSPTGVMATAGDGHAVVWWIAPASNGGAAIASYAVTATPGGRTVTTTGATTATVTGLTNGTAYRFTVTATNAIGSSQTSALSTAVTPSLPGGFTGIAPTRVLDTRFGTGAPTAKLGAGQSLTLTVPGLPAGVSAVALNVAVTSPTVTSFLTVYPGGKTRPTAGSNLNFVAGQTIPNMVMVPLGPGNTVTFYNHAGTVDVIADLVGTFAPGNGAGFTGRAPTRVLDTRFGTGAPTAKLGGGQSLTLTVPGLPAGVTSVACNVAVTNPTSASFLTVYPGGTTRPPLGSNLNFVAGQTIPNLVLVPLGPGNTVTFFNYSGTVDVIADLMGYYATGTGSRFTGQAPTRVLDTREGTGAPEAKLGAGQSLTLTVPGLPAGVTAVAFNVAVTNPTSASYLTVYPGGKTRPTTGSNLNYVAGQTIPNMVLVPVGPGNTVTFYNHAGTVDVIADLVGYYN